MYGNTEFICPDIGEKASGRINSHNLRGIAERALTENAHRRGYFNDPPLSIYMGHLRHRR